jgi:hypothetical protein
MLTNLSIGVIEVPSSNPPQWMHWMRVTLPAGVRPQSVQSRFESSDRWVEFEPIATDRWTASAYAITGSSLLAPSERRRMEQHLNGAVQEAVV